VLSRKKKNSDLEATLLPAGRPCWGAVGVSFLLNAAWVSALVALPMLFPQQLVPMMRYRVVPLSTLRTEVPMRRPSNAPELVKTRIPPEQPVKPLRIARLVAPPRISPPKPTLFFPRRNVRRLLESLEWFYELEAMNRALQFPRSGKDLFEGLFDVFFSHPNVAIPAGTNQSKTEVSSQGLTSKPRPGGDKPESGWETAHHTESEGCIATRD
jgi:hypothetical protein